MDRLSSMDASFLEMEVSGPSVAVGSVIEIAGAPPTLAQLREFVAQRLPDMPRFTQAVVRSRTVVRQAKWVHVEPDLDHHIRGVELSPGEGFDDTVSSVMEIPLDTGRPLWDMTQVTGYSEERWCLIIRLHHSIADGQGAVILLGRLIDLRPDGGTTLADAIVATLSPEPEPEPERDADQGSGLEAVLRKSIRSVEIGFDVAGRFISTYPDTLRTLYELLPSGSSDLTGPVSSSRRWVGGRCSLPDIKKARKAYKGATINDMVLAAVAYGFTRLLETRGEPTRGRTLRAVMPVSLRRNFDANNQVSILPAPLPLGDMDPARRMRIIRSATRHSKRSMLPVILDGGRRAVEKVVPAPIQEYAVSRGALATQYVSETLVTNVPGPPVRLFLMGQEVVNNTPIIPIEGGMRIIVGITSFLDELNVGITGDGEHAPDVDVLLAGILEGFEQIVATAAERAAARKAARAT